MGITREQLEKQIEQFSDSELDVLAGTTKRLIQSRDARASRVQECIEKIEIADELTRFVVEQYIRTYVEVDQLMIESGECGWTEEFVGFSHRESITLVAPGVYWASAAKDMHEVLAQTGEFKTFQDFDDAAEELQFPGRKKEYRRVVPQALDTVDHLVHWLAARYPDSDAADVVRHHGTKTGRLVHGSTTGYPSSGLLFHESVLEDYIQRECMRRDVQNGPHRPIITLVSTGDWDKAVALCDSKRQRQLQSRKPRVLL